MKSTNYQNTFISVADSCPRNIGAVPPDKSPPIIARLTYDLIAQNPYQYTSDEILWHIYCARTSNPKMSDFQQINHACLRCSSLAKTYGWGFHFESMGRVAIYGAESTEYQMFLDNADLDQKPAFSSKK